MRDPIDNPVTEDLTEMRQAIRDMKESVKECKDAVSCLLSAGGTPSVFVFGSNLAGRHGAGAAKFALEHRGAIYGRGEGRQGNSYGIPTKDRDIRTLPLEEIQKGVERFLNYARNNPDMTFQVTKIGCGLAGYKEEQIAPMFEGAPYNCVLPVGWRNE